jgi:RND superfamily putative drug exporter
MVTTRPVSVAVAAIAVLATVAIPSGSLQMALPDNGSAAAHTEPRQTYDIISATFGPGYNGPLVLVVDSPARLGDRPARTVAASVRRMPGVAAVAAPQPTRRTGQYILMVVPSTGPDQAQTADLVHAIRDRAPATVADTATTVAVTGNTAVAIDVSNRLSDSLIPFLAIVVCLSVALLIIVFRSIAVPIKAASTFLLSIGASLGATVAVFQWGWGAGLLAVTRPGPVVSFLPIVLVGVLFGLAMDYQVFLVSGIREKWTHTRHAPTSIVAGTQRNARVVTAAATIMIAVFASFVPTDNPVVKSIAFALAIGVFLDAFLVRLTLVPALLRILGRHAWWLPALLERVVPTLDLEPVTDDPARVSAPGPTPHLEPDPALPT